GTYQEVPLVDHEDGRLGIFQHVTGQLLVHLADRLLRLVKKQHHVGPAYRPLRTRQAVKLDVRADAAFFPDPGSIDGHDRLAVQLETDIDAVAGSAGHFADDHALGFG